ncbi:hypothetical protein ACQKP3_24900, partial [Vibrio sp. DNB22_10_4]
LALLWLLLVGRPVFQMTTTALAFGTFLAASFAGGMYFEWQNSRTVMRLLANPQRQGPDAHAPSASTVSTRETR